MKGGSERRALPARRHVGGAKIIRDRDAEHFRQLRAVADLHGQPLLRLMQHGLAVKTDNGDIGRHDLMAAQKLLDDLGMDFGDECFRLFQDAGPLSRSVSEAPSASASRNSRCSPSE